MDASLVLYLEILARLPSMSRDVLTPQELAAYYNLIGCPKLTDADLA